MPGTDFKRWIRTPRLDDAYLVGAVDVATLRQIRSELGDPNANLRTSAYVEHETSATAELRSPGRAGTVESADLLDSGRIVVNARRDAFLVVSEDWERGWHATVDGKSVPVLRTNGLVIGLAVPPGRHVVQIEFTPPGLRLGALVALFAILALVLAAPVVSLVQSIRRSGTLRPWANREKSARVGMLAPMQPELQPIVRRLGMEGDGSLYRGRAGAIEVIAMLTMIGMTAGAQAAQRILEHDVDWVMVVGIAGGVDRSVPIGGVIVPEVVIDRGRPARGSGPRSPASSLRGECSVAATS